MKNKIFYLPPIVDDDMMKEERRPLGKPADTNTGDYALATGFGEERLASYVVSGDFGTCNSQLCHIACSEKTRA